MSLASAVDIGLFLLGSAAISGGLSLINPAYGMIAAGTIAISLVIVSRLGGRNA